RYFRKITDGLRGAGTQFHTPRVPPTASVSVRAERLRELVDELPGERVNVIAHSMGGLDARYAISRLGLSERVLSLVTVGTPHFGTPLADLGAGLVPDTVSRALSRVVDVRALHDLTTDALDRFHRDVPVVPCGWFMRACACSTVCPPDTITWSLAA